VIGLARANPSSAFDALEKWSGSHPAVSSPPQ
jgi:hypothetical protein